MAIQILGRVAGSKIYSGSAVGNTDIQHLLDSKQIKPLQYDLYVCTAHTCLYQYMLVNNKLTWTYLMSLKGDAGTFAISKVYKSVNDMHAGYSTDGLPKGALVVIETGYVSNEDNAKLYVKGNTQYEFLTDMSGSRGIQGPQGEPGKTPTLSLVNGDLIVTYE